jgi:hypothetical protein
MAEENLMADQNHQPQSGDRNLNYVAEKDKPQQESRDKEIEQGEERMHKASKRDEGIR